MLEVRNVRHVYPNGYQALNDVSLTVQDGEVAAIIGRSGAGKSTLLRCINGMERAAAGSIHIDGVDVVQAHGEALRQIQTQVGFIWQEYNLIERLSVMNNVLSGRLGRRQDAGTTLFHFDRFDREVAVHSLEKVNMLHRAQFRADRLSGGEKQRVSIARAIAQGPRVILADEPVASLDPELSEQVIEDLVRVARDEGVPTLINLHDVELAVQFCDRIVAIAQGIVVYDGPPSGLTDDVLNRTYRFDRNWKSYARGVIAEASATVAAAADGHAGELVEAVAGPLERDTDLVGSVR